MVLLESFAILAIRAMILLYARTSSLGRNTAHDVPLLLFPRAWSLCAETEATGEEETRRTRRNSKGTTDPMIGPPGLVLPRVVEAINVDVGVGSFPK